MTKTALCATLGAIGGAIMGAFGRWDASLTALVAFMTVDYLSGLIVAAVFKKSGKSENGGLESRAGLKGLTRKGMILALVFVAAQIDMLIGSTFVRNAAVIGFAVNEALSIVENAGLMGVPMPPAITNALEVLKRKADNAAEPKDGK